VPCPQTHSCDFGKIFVHTYLVPTLSDMLVLWQRLKKVLIQGGCAIATAGATPEEHWPVRHIPSLTQDPLTRD
jgi:hypothetical protein